MSPTLTTSRRLSSSPTQSFWLLHRSPNKGSPEDVEYDDAAFEDMLREAHRVQVHHSQREDLSVGQSSSVSERTVRPVGERTGRPAESSSHDAQIRTLLDRQKERILAECQAEMKQSRNSIWLWPKKCTKIWWYYWISAGRTSSCSSWRTSTSRITASSWTVIAAKFGSSWSSWEKSQWDGRIEAISRVHFRYNFKEKIDWRPKHDDGAESLNSGITVWN